MQESKQEVTKVVSLGKIVEKIPGALILLNSLQYLSYNLNKLILLHTAVTNELGKQPD